jgi:hypothetical protein
MNRSALLASALASLLLHNCASLNQASGQATMQNPLVGAWLITETACATSEGIVVNEEPQTGLYVFTERHFSLMLIPNAEARPLFSENRTDQERLAAYDNFIADAGTYEAIGNVLTTHNMIAKVPNAMDYQLEYQFSLEEDALVLSFDRGWAPPCDELTYRLRRLE